MTSLSDPSTWTQAELLREAQMWQGAMFSKDEPQGQPAASYHWHYDPAAPLERFEAFSSRRQAVTWFKAEVKMQGEEGREDIYDDMAEPIREPVVAIEIGGKLYLWDGHHRLASSYAYRRPTVPAIIGRPR